MYKVVTFAYQVWCSGGGGRRERDGINNQKKKKRNMTCNDHWLGRDYSGPRARGGFFSAPGQTW